jgi:CubicO group peptidase (beta-lactamase class C family)
MVGAVIEKKSGERFDQYVKKHILEPLGLYAGYCVDSLDASRFVTLYEYDAKTKGFKASASAYNPRSEEIRNYVAGQSTPVFSPTGGMKISATDLAKYMTMHMNYGKYNGVRIISKKSAKAMQTPIAKEEGYALALTNLDDLIPGKHMVGHTGSAYGLYSSMFFQPKEKFGIVTITNGVRPATDRGMPKISRALINSLYSAYFSTQ